jgi:hypothetical protein
MKGRKRRVTSSDVPLLSRFEQIRGLLLGGAMNDRLDKPLSFWALPGDRQLPFALPNHPVRMLLASSFDELYGTAGIGRKKVATLLRLLERVADNSKPEASEALHEADGQADLPGTSSAGELAVSEAIWHQWCERLTKLGLINEPLGHLAPSLQELPRSIWITPLGDFLCISLADLRELKTFGTKRVQAVIDVVASIYTSIAAVATNDHLAVRLVPRCVERIEAWMQQAFADLAAIDAASVSEGLIAPIKERIVIDGGEKLALVAEARLAPKTSVVNIRQIAFRLTVTPSRIYQLLDDIRAIVQLRWPRGEAQLRDLHEHMSSAGCDAIAIELVAAAHSLFTEPE